MHEVDLGSLANRLIRQGRPAAVATITSSSTGNPALQRLDLSGLDLFVGLQYADADQPVPGRRLQSLADVSRQVTELGLRGRIDLAVVDPYHSYTSSFACLGLGLDLLRPGGTMLVHDCLPPLSLTGQTFVEGAWCGVTFAAFRDACRARGLRWFTLNADFGLGVVVAGDAGAGTAAPVEPVPLAETLAQYEQDPYAVMNVIDVADLDEALARVSSGRDVADLVPTFAGWEGALVEGAPAVPPEVRIATLQRDLDTAHHELGEWLRPRRQLAGLAHSVPGALRARVERARSRRRGLS